LTWLGKSDMDQVREGSQGAPQFGPALTVFLPALMRGKRGLGYKWLGDGEEI